MISFKLNKSDYKFIWVFTAGMFFWLILKFWTEKHPFEQIVFDIPIIIAKTLAAFFILRWLIQKYLVEKKQYILFIVLSTASLIATGFLDLLRDYYGSGYGWKDLPSWGYIIIHSFYYSAADLATPFIFIVTKKYFEEQAKLTTIKKQQKDSELKLLRSQLSPHFLFNNLNTVDALIDTNPTKAKEYISRLSSLYRYLISTQDQEIVPLHEEIAMAQDYFYLIKTRFGDAYTFDICNDVHDIAFAKAYLPTGTLQTLLENVVKHNKVIHGKSINTSIEMIGDTMTVTNSKSSHPTIKESFGTGLKNLKERYALLIDKTVTITDSNTQFIVTLPMVTLLESK